MEEKRMEYKNRVICGDNVEVMRGMPDNCIDLTVTSPPYDNLRSYHGYSFNFEEVAKELYRITKPGGVVVWVVGDATIKGSETGTSFRQALYFKEIGFNLHDTMIYEKSGCGACGSDKAYIQNFEYMFIFSKDIIATFNLIYDRENKRVGKIKTNGKRNIFTADNGRKYRVIETKKEGRRFNVWRYNQIGGQDKYSNSHPAPFPEQLANDHIISWSNPGDLVFDPFVGSGTTCKMAVLNGRNYLGIDISEEYCQIARKRIKYAKKKQSLKIF